MESVRGLRSEMIGTSHSVYLTDALFGFILYLLTLVSDVRISGHFSMIFFIIYMILLIRNRTLFFLKYLAVIAFVAMNLLGCYVAEYTNLYLSELTIYSGFVGSLPLLAFSRWFVFPVMTIVDQLYGTNIQSYKDISMKKTKWIDSFSLIFIVLVLICFARVILQPAFLLKVDRFDFSNSIVSVGLFGTISAHLSDFSIIPMLSIRHGNKRLGVFCLAIYALYLFWIGTRFGAYFTLIAMLVLTFYDKLQSISPEKIRHFAYISILMIVVLVLIAVRVRSLTSNSSLQSVDYLLQRTAQQGQLWWQTYDIEKHNATRDHSFTSEILNQLTASTRVADNVGSTIGIYGVMYRTGPTDLVSLHLSKGSAYAEGGYAAAYYYFGAVGTIAFSILLGFLISIVTNSFLSSMVYGRILETVILARIYGSVRGFMGTFIFTGLISFVSIISYCYIFLSWLLRVHKSYYDMYSRSIAYH